jgi:putative transcriptional regulator
MKNNIKFLRRKMGLRQEDVAEKVDVTRQTIIAIENNKYNPTLELAIKLGRLFDKHVDEIFQLDDEIK